MSRQALTEGGVLKEFFRLDNKFIDEIVRGI